MAKLTLQLSPEMDAVLDELSETRDLPKSQVLRRAVLLMKYLDDQVADNKDILLRDTSTGEANRLVLESELSRPAMRRRSEPFTGKADAPAATSAPSAQPAQADPGRHSG